jgi:hypothetical protein
MSDFQQEKNIVLEFYEALDSARPGEVEGVLKGAVVAITSGEDSIHLTFTPHLHRWPVLSGTR